MHIYGWRNCWWALLGLVQIITQCSSKPRSKAQRKVLKISGKLWSVISIIPLQRLDLLLRSIFFLKQHCKFAITESFQICLSYRSVLSPEVKLWIKQDICTVESDHGQFLNYLVIRLEDKYVMFLCCPAWFKNPGFQQCRKRNLSLFGLGFTIP